MLDSSYVNFGANGKRALYSSNSLQFGVSSELTLEGETWMAKFLSNGSNVFGNMRTDARRLWLSTVGTHEHELEISVRVSPSVSMGLREDGKHGE